MNVKKLLEALVEAAIGLDSLHIVQHQMGRGVCLCVLEQVAGCLQEHDYIISFIRASRVRFLYHLWNTGGQTVAMTTTA